MAERPLECGECRRPIAVQYTEIVGGTSTEFIACSQCPVWQRRLYGDVHPGEVSSAKEAGLCCGPCGTTLEAVQVGHTLGCPTCYEVFGDLLVHDLVTSQKVSRRVTAKGKTAVPLHIGRLPGDQTSITPAAKITALTEALNETLAREDYEQAAYLRDQIKRISAATADAQISEPAKTGDVGDHGERRKPKPTEPQA